MFAERESESFLAPHARGRIVVLHPTATAGHHPTTSPGPRQPLPLPSPRTAGERWWTKAEPRTFSRIRGCATHRRSSGATKGVRRRVHPIIQTCRHGFQAKIGEKGAHPAQKSGATSCRSSSWVRCWLSVVAMEWVCKASDLSILCVNSLRVPSQTLRSRQGFPSTDVDVCGCSNNNNNNSVFCCLYCRFVDATTQNGLHERAHSLPCRRSVLLHVPFKVQLRLRNQLLWLLR